MLSLVDRVTRCAGARLRFSLGACFEYTFLPSTQIKRTSPRSTCAIDFCSIKGVSKFLKKAWCCVGGSRVDNVIDVSSVSPTSDEGLMLETSASKSLYGGQFTLSTQLIKSNYLISVQLN